MPWNVRTLRLTLFRDPASQDRPAPNWRALVRRDPHNQIRRPDQVIENGPFESAWLQLQIQLPLRIDLVYGLAPQPATDPANPVPHLGPPGGQMGEFHTAALALLELSPPVTRVALGAQLFQLAPTNAEACRLLAEHIGAIDFHLDGGEDLSYQITRPRLSYSNPGLRINRLVKWQAINMQPVTIDMATGQAMQGPPTSMAALETDINTDAERRSALESRGLHGLLEEIENQTNEVIERGDIV